MFPASGVDDALEACRFLDRVTFVAPRAPRPSPKHSCAFGELVDPVVRAVRIMVKQDQATSLGPLGELDRVPDTRVTPADPGRVLALAELAVVKKQVRRARRARGRRSTPDSRSASSTPRTGSWSGMYASAAPFTESRYPSVGPGWDTVVASIRTPSISHGSCGTSWNVTFAGVSVSSIGKSGGENARVMRSSSECSGEGGPQMCNSVSACQNGAKNLKPSTWSRCRCVTSTCNGASHSSCAPSRRRPVPASRMSRAPSSVRTSTRRVAAKADGRLAGRGN